MIVKQRCNECKNVTHVHRTPNLKPYLIHSMALVILTALLTSAVLVTKLSSN